MKIISWNVNGIRSVDRKGLFTPFVTTYSPDIICLQETKAEQGQSPVDLPEYEEYWCSAVRKGYSGTAIFTKIKPLSVLLNFDSEISSTYSLADDYGDANAEGRVLTLEFEKFFLVNVYTPNSKDDLSRLDFRHKHWDPAFLAHVEKLEAKKPVIFCGDLNVAHMPIDLARPKDNEGEHGFTNEEREGINKIIEAGFFDTFRHFVKEGEHYTWWSNWGSARLRNVGWRIDYFFVSKRLLPSLLDAQILKNTLGSDHCPIMIEIKIK